MQQIFKVFILFAFVIAVIATPVPVRKRQGCPKAPDSTIQSDTFAVSSSEDTHKEPVPFNCT
jgi:hypothetical protein